MMTRTLLTALICAALLATAAPAAALDAVEAERVFTARFAAVAKAYAGAKASLPEAARAEGEAMLARASRSAADKGFDDANGDLDAVESLLASPPKAEKAPEPEKTEPAKAKKGKAKKGPAEPKKAKKAAPKRAPEPEPADAGDDGDAAAAAERESSLPPVEFTLEEAFRPKEEPAKAGASAAAEGEEAPQPKKAPKLKEFDVKNLDDADRKNLNILYSIMPQVEGVFKNHPNPETAEAMKQTRRFIYYLKKRACGYPAERETDAALDLFIQSRIKKVRVIEK